MKHVLLECAAALSLAVVLAAHVGSPDVYFSGKAGAYDVSVVITPPTVVPGVADVFVRVADTTVSRVTIRPVFWRAGTRGAPAGDEMSRVKGAAGSFTGRLWLMAAGSSGVDVQVTGARGTANVLVPVAALPTGQLGLGTPLRIILVILGVLLVAGGITTTYVGAGESQLAPGETMTSVRRNAARRGAAIAVLVLTVVVVGGAKWWQSEADAYRSTLYRPVVTHSFVDTGRVPVLVMKVDDRSWRQGNVTPIMPDHGKLAHLFMVRADSPYVFAHLHPTMPDGATFSTPLPPLPAGRYRIFTDVVHESGFERTLADSIILRTNVDSAGMALLSPDDAWSENEPIVLSSKVMDLSGHDGDLFVRWAGQLPAVAKRPGAIHVRVFDRKYAPLTLEPYLGMLAHAVVMRDDGKVFVHLHPSGTTSMASQAAFRLRDRGDTAANGRLRLDDASMPMLETSGPVQDIVFPYAFPDSGRYRVWVQMRRAGRVHTTGYELKVSR